MEIKTRMIIELLGSPKEHIEDIMSKVFEELKKRKGLEILKKEISQAKKIEKLYSIFCEMEVRFKEVSDLLNVCFDFMPSTIEILEPSELNLKDKELEDFLNDLVARLHKHSMVMRNLHAENVLLKQKSKES